MWQNVRVNSRDAVGAHTRVQATKGHLGKGGGDKCRVSFLHLSRCDAPSAGWAREPRLPRAERGSIPGRKSPLQEVAWRNSAISLGKPRLVRALGVVVVSNFSSGLAFHSRDFGGPVFFGKEVIFRQVAGDFLRLWKLGLRGLLSLIPTSKSGVWKWKQGLMRR